MNETSNPAPAGPFPICVLLLEQNPDDVELSLCALTQDGFCVESDGTRTSEEFEQKVRDNSYDVVLADCQLGGWTGIDALRMIERLGLNLPLILVTGTRGEERAVECIKLGVSDYVLKHQLSRLPTAVRHALQQKETRTPDEAVRLDEFLKREMAELMHAGIWQHKTKSGKTIDAAIMLHGMESASRPAWLIAALSVTEKRELEFPARELRGIRFVVCWIYEVISLVFSAFSCRHRTRRASRRRRNDQHRAWVAGRDTRRGRRKRIRWRAREKCDALA